MKLIDEIKILQEQLNKMLIENKCDKKQILEFSQKLDDLIAGYYIKDDKTNKD